MIEVILFRCLSLVHNNSLVNGSVVMLLLIAFDVVISFSIVHTHVLFCGSVVSFSIRGALQMQTC